MVWIFSKVLKNLFNLILLKSFESNFFFILKFGGLRLKNIIDVSLLRFEIRQVFFCEVLDISTHPA